MKKTCIVLFILLSFAAYMQAQNNDNNPKHVNYYKIPEQVKTDSIMVSFEDVVAKMDYVKMKVKIVNNTANYIEFNVGESSFIYKSGEFKTTKNGSSLFKKDVVFIKPFENISRVIESAKSTNYHRDTFQLKLSLFKVPANGTVQAAPDFMLPAKTNNFTAGNFKVNMDKISKETQKTEVKFKCDYSGQDVGIIKPSEVSVKLDNGQVFATTETKNKPILLQKGDEENLYATFEIPAKIADMQFANMNIMWNKTFEESIEKPINIAPVKFVVDPGMTDGKNK